MNQQLNTVKRTRKPREQRKAEIVDVATRILIDKGHSELTLRGVAKEAGIRLSTLQHYYESRELLLDAIIDKRLRLYRDTYVKVQAEASNDPEQQLMAVVRFLLDDSMNQQTCGFFTQLWALGFQSEEARCRLSDLYANHRKDLAAFIGCVNPNIEEQECLARAAMISSMIEGSLIHIGTGEPDVPELVGLRQRFAQHIMAFIKS
ncbi:TetR/AcrR family transcriptional regulator [Vreelandella neptunia]|uniref:TetR/AcrR family transcriptional regulator n=1 Tax=Vreelandella neptunia TaxID=115551 RepID=UPI00315B1EC8